MQRVLLLFLAAAVEMLTLAGATYGDPVSDLMREEGKLAFSVCSDQHCSSSSASLASRRFRRLRLQPP
jgi:hypothetical protein